MTIARKLLTSAASAVALWTTPASAAVVTGGTTDVTLTAAPTLTDLGLTAAPTGTATVSTDMEGIPTFTFPVTGGSIDDMSGTALLFHNGSGILFTAGDNSLSIGDFVIDTGSALVLGNASANGSALGVVPLFDIGAGTSLFLTADAAGAFTSVFGAPDLTGVNVGFARVNATTAAVPEPGTWMRLLLGFGGIGMAMRYSRKRVRALAA